MNNIAKISAPFFDYIMDIIPNDVSRVRKKNSKSSQKE